MENKTNDFNKVMDFIIQIDGLKRVFRQTKIVGGERFENDAEHSWHISVMAYALGEFFDGAADVSRAVKMLLIHDVVELYAGDTYCYNIEANKDKYERELASAKKVFGLLPKDIAEEFMSLWLEFDEEETPDAIFASIMDKIQPLILNYQNKGESWLLNGISKSQVLGRIGVALEKGPEPLRDYITEIIEKSVQKGYLADK